MKEITELVNKINWEVEESFEISSTPTSSKEADWLPFRIFFVRSFALSLFLCTK
jgi:hypothetical protein